MPLQPTSPDSLVRANRVEPADVRRTVLSMLHRAKASHLGSNMSVIEMMIAMFGAVDCDKIRAGVPDRSRILVSKGHCAAATYATMAHHGVIPFAMLETYHLDGSILSGHVSHAVPGVEHSTGALGHGLNVAVGCALGLRARGLPRRPVLTLVGDGELQEGSIWEGLMFASHQKLSNLVTLVDNNGISSITNTEKVIDMRPLRSRFEGFGLAVRTVDGHHVGAIGSAIGGIAGRRPSGRDRLQHDERPRRTLRGGAADLALSLAQRATPRRGPGTSGNRGTPVMRGQIINAVFDRMATDPDIFFLTADMGINLVERFGETYPDRFVNVGIAEQNLVGVSAGLANLGFRPFAYTISNFAIHRCFEQIRNDICLHHYPITLLGTSTGYNDAPLGPTHHMMDDWGALKALPNIDIYCPCSTTYAASLIDRIVAARRPAYVRIPKGEFKRQDSDAHMVKIPGKRDDVLLVSYGTPTQTCLQVQEEDPSVSVLLVNRLRPLDPTILWDALAPHRRILVVEDHFPWSGLYGSLCEFVAEYPIQGRLSSAAPRDYSFEVGTSAQFYFKKFGMDVAALLKAVA